MAKRVLMLVTSHDKMDDAHPTGIWLSEFAEPYEEFQKAGYHITVTSPKGGAAPIDPRSLNEENERRWAAAIERLKDTVPVTAVNSDEYDALFVPGGHGTMFDFPFDPNVQQLVRRFAEANKVIAAVCHGPAALVGVTLSNGQPLVAGKRVTAFTDEEERAVQLDKLVPFLLETRLRELGANFIAGEKWADHVEQDGLLITGQNPQSGISTAKAVIRTLESTTGA